MSPPGARRVARRDVPAKTTAPGRRPARAPAREYRVVVAPAGEPNPAAAEAILAWLAARGRPR
jgi:hypothetical protein